MTAACAHPPAASPPTVAARRPTPPRRPGSPPCQPAFTGGNGGTTTHGVTRDTITISYRRGQSTEDTAVYAAAGDAAPDPDDLYLADMRDFINLFNKTYELYGRKVVLKDFQG